MVEPTPLKNISQNWKSSPNWGENEKIFKTTTQLCITNILVGILLNLKETNLPVFRTSSVRRGFHGKLPRSHCYSTWMRNDILNQGLSFCNVCVYGEMATENHTLLKKLRYPDPAIFMFESMIFQSSSVTLDSNPWHWWFSIT